MLLGSVNHIDPWEDQQMCIRDSGKVYTYYDNDSISYILNQGLPYNTSGPDNDRLNYGYLYRDGSDAYPGSGTYTDTLTFTFAVSNK